jgi:hypothetical protein
MKTKRKPAKKALPAPAVQTGAARALERLEAEEASLFTAYETAKAGKDALEIKLARDAWLKTSESLRKFDLLIEAARRETGELVPRQSVEEYLQLIGHLLHVSFCRIVGRDESWQIADNAFCTFVAKYDNKEDRAAVLNISGWMHRALFRDGDWRRGEDLETTLTAMRVIQEALDRHRDDEHKFFEYLKAKLLAPHPHERTS